LISNDGFSVVAPMNTSVPVFDERQERVLLRLVEAMHLVEEQHGSTPGCEPHLRLVDRQHARP
jgi:hypothetical protein